TIPVVIASMRAEEARSGLLGAVEFLQKPFSRSTIESILLEHLPRDAGRVLIVDDDPDIRFLLTNLLSDRGFEFREATNGREALDVLADFSPDLVLLDLQMPVMNGFEFLSEIRSDPHHLHLPVVIQTGKELTDAEIGDLSSKSAAILRKQELDAPRISKLLGDVIGTRLKTARHARMAAISPTGAESEKWSEAVTPDARAWYRSELAARLLTLTDASRDLDLEPALNESSRRIVHILRGSGSMYGFPDITAAARAVEESSDQERGTRLEELIAVLCRAIDDH
ncbi:MAG: response regulator, partial [Candidatus Hydrogenedentota bacterium]